VRPRPQARPQKLQREGLLPMKPEAVFGAGRCAERGGPGCGPCGRCGSAADRALNRFLRFTLE